MRAWNIPKLFVGLSIVVFILIFIIQGFTEEATRLTIRLSARFSFIFFCLAFTASAAQYFWKGQFTFWLLMNRKFLGITFAFIHLIHLGLLVLLQIEFHPVFEMAKTSSLLGGGGAYVFVMIMLLTSFDVIRSKLNIQVWKALHTIGAYWIAAVYFVSYTKRALEQWEYRPLLLLLFVIIVLRIAKLLGVKFNYR